MLNLNYKELDYCYAGVWLPITLYFDIKITYDIQLVQ